jgi:hypothetical protein
MLPEKIVWPKSGEIAGEWRRLHNDEHYERNCSPNLIWKIKSRIRT